MTVISNFLEFTSSADPERVVKLNHSPTTTMMMNLKTIENRLVYN
jgi:hypothetical protein